MTTKLHEKLKAVETLIADIYREIEQLSVEKEYLELDVERLQEKLTGAN